MEHTILPTDPAFALQIEAAQDVGAYVEQELQQMVRPPGGLSPDVIQDAQRRAVAAINASNRFPFRLIIRDQQISGEDKTVDLVIEVGPRNLN